MDFDDMEKLDLDKLRNMTTDDGTDINVMIRQMMAKMLLGSLSSLYGFPTDGPVFDRLTLFSKEVDEAESVADIEKIATRLLAFAETAAGEQERIFKKELYEYTGGNIDKAREILCIDLPSDYFDDTRGN